MSDIFTNVPISLMSSGQSQKEVTFNTAVRMMLLFAERRVLDKDLTAPPGSPTEEDAYIIGGSATGAWTGKDGQIAQYVGGEWKYYVPRQGWLFYVLDEDKYYKRGASTWAITAI